MKKRIIISVITAVCLFGLISSFTVVADSFGYEQTSMPQVVEPTRRTLDMDVYEQAYATMKDEDNALYTKLMEERKHLSQYHPTDPNNEKEVMAKNCMLSAETAAAVDYENLGTVIDIVARARYCESDLYKPLAEGEVYNVCYDENATTTFGGDQDKICNFVVACCNTLNDQSVELTPVEVVRLQDFIRHKFAFLYKGYMIEETSKSIETCELIRQTLPEDPLA